MSLTETAKAEREQRIESLLPVVDTDVFDSHPEAVFWIGKVAGLKETEYNENLFEAAAHLRANVYIDEKKYLSEDARRFDGTERDEYDSRSVQIVAVEKSDDASRVVGVGRLIVRLSEDDKLPIEQYFPEVFEDNPIKSGSVEVSRFIARHPDKFTQHAISLAIIRAMAYETVDMGASTDYCMIEKPLQNMLERISLPVEQLGEQKDIPEQNGILYPVEINSHLILQQAKIHKAGREILNAFFANEDESRGQGLYNATLMQQHGGGYV